MTCSSSDTANVVVIGAGPVGLYTVFQLGLLGLSCHLIDALPFAGGQCQQLYPHKPIYDVPGLLKTTGSELIEALLAQIHPFAPQFHLGDVVRTLEPIDGTLWHLTTTKGKTLTTHSVVIAAGVGAFEPKPMRWHPLAANDQALPTTEPLYTPPPPPWSADPQSVIFWLGDGESAWANAEQWIMQYAQSFLEQGHTCKMVHRKSLSSEQMAVLERFNLPFQAALPQAWWSSLQQLQVQPAVAAEPQTLPCTQLWAFTSLSPQLKPLEGWGLAMVRKQLQVNEYMMTSAQGLYAVGDITHYLGKKRLLISGFHEATLAAYAIAQRHAPTPPEPLQYTSTSRLMHMRLKV